jgi:hypothetical protein
MKSHITTCTVFSLLFLSISCNKEKIKIDEYWGEATATKNGVHWNSYPSGGISNLDDRLFVSCNTYSKEGYHREQLLMYSIPIEINDYIITKSPAKVKFYTSTDDGDVTGDIYNISDSDSLSLVSITRIEGKEVWGTFSLTLYRDTSRVHDPGVPDTLIFTDGEFHTKILE